MRARKERKREGGEFCVERGHHHHDRIQLHRFAHKRLFGRTFFYIATIVNHTLRLHFQRRRRRRRRRRRHNHLIPYRFEKRITRRASDARVALSFFASLEMNARGMMIALVIDAPSSIQLSEEASVRDAEDGRVRGRKRRFLSARNARRAVVERDVCSGPF